MAGSGIGPQNYDGGWISGSSTWYTRHTDRRAKFLAAHPEWTIVYIRSIDRHEAAMGDKDADEGLTILQDKSLGQLMDRLEARYPAENPHP